MDTPSGEVVVECDPPFLCEDLHNEADVSKSKSGMDDDSENGNILREQPEESSKSEINSSVSSPYSKDNPPKEVPLVRIQNHKRSISYLFQSSLPSDKRISLGRKIQQDTTEADMRHISDSDLSSTSMIQIQPEVFSPAPWQVLQVDLSDGRECRKKAVKKDSGGSTRASVKKTDHICYVLGCNRRYGKMSHLRAHMRKHTGEKPFVCEWMYCGKSFSRSDELRRHWRTHSGEKQYECPVCKKKFMRSDHLRKHSTTHQKRSFIVGTSSK